MTKALELDRMDQEAVYNALTAHIETLQKRVTDYSLGPKEWAETNNELGRAMVVRQQLLEL